MKVLGIESSCDETACAIVEDGRTILSNVVATQIPFHKIYKGVVPEIASRKHAEWILPVVRQALKEANMTLDDVDAIAATNRPGLMGSLLVGFTFGKTLAWQQINLLSQSIICWDTFTQPSCRLRLNILFSDFS